MNVNYYSIYTDEKVSIDFDRLNDREDVIKKEYVILKESPKHKIYVDVDNKATELHSKQVHKANTIDLGDMKCDVGVEKLESKVYNNDKHDAPIGLSTIYAVPLESGGYMNIVRNQIKGKEDIKVYYRSAESSNNSNVCLHLKEALKKVVK